MTTNMTIDERYYRAGQLEQFISDQRAEFEDRDLPPDDVHQSLKNAEEELARHTAVIDQRKAWDRQMIEGVRSGRYQVESGDGRTVDLGRNSDHSHDHVPQWLSRQRDEALRTVDRYTRSDHLDAPAAGRLDALVRASGTKIDPAGIGARYLAAVGLPAYNRLRKDLGRSDPRASPALTRGSRRRARGLSGTAGAGTERGHRLRWPLRDSVHARSEHRDQ
jgi:hypothetical protein